ncbi:MAG: MFS transporter [Deltaproteobacteria bacterium CG11_big_fil_rev_8_21_14_0_20_47_16]|nr:MAG: MFS transporter [Deltaproteobacteria bacterium CG11_big_fil_rev_8_21_14_0_20_47_16]
MTDAYAALKVPRFKSLVTIRFLAVLAVQMQGVAVGWQMYALTHDPLALGLVGLSEALPAISMGLFAGHFVDHHDRRMILSLALATCTAMAIALYSFTVLPHTLGTWPLYVAVAIVGIARSFFGPAMFSLTGHVVPKNLYGNAMTWSTTFWQTGAVTGPLIAGFVYIAGPEWVYISEAIIFLLAVVLSRRIPSMESRVLSVVMPVMKSLMEGIRFVTSHPVILGALSLDMFAIFFGGAVALLPIYAKDILFVGPVGLGWLRAVPAIGSILVSLFLAHNAPKQYAGKILLGCVAGFGLCIIGFGLSKLFILSLVLLCVSGVLDGVSVVLRGTIVQTFTPDAMRGRVASVNMMFIGSSNELGAFESGVAARLMGTVPAVVFGGIMTLVVVTAAAFKWPQLRKLKL